MKKVLAAVAVSVLTLAGIQNAFADGSANIRMDIAGATNDNAYFLCLPNVGCLSILAADKGKTYPIFEPLEMSNIYVTDVGHKFRVSNEGLPSSCHVTVQPNHTITVHGSLKPMPNGTVLLSNLHCTVS